MKVAFCITEYPDGTPWIMCQSAGPDIFNGKGYLGVEVPTGTTFEQAKRIADYLNDNVVAITYTKFP